MGGAGGHMRHPHDLNEVDSGKDVIALFRAIPAYLKSKEFEGGETSSLKLDGSNNGLRLVYRDGRYQFAIDRGSKGELDIQGVTADQLEDRFKSKPVIDPETGEETVKQHGMVASSSLLLNMMNVPLEERRDEMFSVLKELGFLVEEEGRLIPDPTKYLSIEYVERKAFDHPTDPNLGRANVIFYPFDFIAFHGVSEFFEMVLKRTGDVVRSGPKPGPEDAGPGKPIPYNRQALSELVELVTPYAPEEFRVFGPVSLKVAAAAGEEGAEDDITGALEQLSQNIERALNTNISIRVRADPNEPPLTMTLEDWLQRAKNFNYQPNIRLTNGKKVSPFHKNIHKALIVDGISVPELVDDPEMGQDQCDLSGKLHDCEKAIYGAIFIEAARILGNTVKKSLMPAVEEFGPAVSHEGIVIDAGMRFGKKKTGHAFKITGEFIVDASGGAYAVNRGEELPGLREDEEVELDIVDAEVADPEGTAAGTDVVALVPGAFKPPHRGHLEMVEKYAQDATKVIVLISDPLLSSRTLEDGTVINASHAKSMWDLLTNHLSNVTVGIYKDPEVRSPMGAAYALAGPPQDREAAMAKVVADPPIEPIKPGSEIILGASTKGGDEKRWSGAEKYVGGGPGGDLVLRDPAVTAKEPTQHSTEYMRILSVSPLKEEMPSVVKGKNPMDFHASDMRYLLSKASEDAEAVELLEDFVGGPKTVKEFLTILGIRSGSSEPELEAPLEEMSAQGVAGGGAVEGGAGGIGPLHRSGSDKPAKRAKKKKKKAKQKEYIDLSLVDEVLELLIERGVTL